MARTRAGRPAAAGAPVEPPNERCRGGYFVEPTVSPRLGRNQTPCCVREILRAGW